MKNRGMLLETLINRTIKFYEKNDFALFHKKELNIKFSKIKKINGKLNVLNGQISTKSTTDYYGVHNGKFYAFEAKSTKLKSLPISNIKEHQIKYLKEIEKYGGITFFIVGFKSYDEYFICDIKLLDELDKKSINIDFLREHAIKLEITYPGILDFLGVL